MNHLRQEPTNIMCNYCVFVTLLVVIGYSMFLYCITGNICSNDKTWFASLANGALDVILLLITI